MPYLKPKVYQFLLRDAMLARYMPWSCVCPSVCVCLSVTSRSSTKMAKHRKTQTTPHDSPGTLVSDAKNLSKFEWGHPQRGFQMQVG